MMEAADLLSFWASDSFGGSRRPWRILVVDDDPTLARGLARNLRLQGFRGVEIALNGEEALASMTAEHFDVVITDLFMPGISGVDVARSAASLSRPPLVWITTATPESPLGNEARALVGERFHSKPVDIDKLVAELEKELMIGRTQSQVPLRAA